MPVFRFALIAGVSVLALTACTGKANPVPPPPVAVAPAAAPISVAPTATVAPMVPLSSLEVPIDPASVAARLSRLEDDVAGMKGQLSQMGPVLEKMPALQSKLGELVTELQRIDARVASAKAHADTLVVPEEKPETQAAMTLVPPPAPVEPGTKPAAPASKASKAIPMKPILDEKPKVKPASKAEPSKKTAAVTGVRVGNDADKTRLVLDTVTKTSFTYDLDNTEKILIVDLSAPDFTAPMTAEFAKSPLIAAYTAQKNNDQYRLVLQLRTPVKVAGAQNLNPNGDKGDRIVIDLVKAPLKE